MWLYSISTKDYKSLHQTEIFVLSTIQSQQKIVCYIIKYVYFLVLI